MAKRITSEDRVIAFPRCKRTQFEGLTEYQVKLALMTSPEILDEWERITKWLGGILER